MRFLISFGGINIYDNWMHGIPQYSFTCNFNSSQDNEISIHTHSFTCEMPVRLI